MTRRRVSFTWTFDPQVVNEAALIGQLNEIVANSLIDGEFDEDGNRQIDTDYSVEDIDE